MKLEIKMQQINTIIKKEIKMKRRKKSMAKKEKRFKE